MCLCVNPEVLAHIVSAPDGRAAQASHGPTVQILTVVGGLALEGTGKRSPGMAQFETAAL